MKVGVYLVVDKNLHSGTASFICGNCELSELMGLEKHGADRMDNTHFINTYSEEGYSLPLLFLH